MLKKSSQLSDDLLTVTRLIRDNTEKSTETLDRLGKLSNYVTVIVIIVGEINCLGLS